MLGPRESPMGERRSADTDPKKRRSATTIMIRAPEVVAINDHDYQQALAALNAMISAWWHDHRNEQSQHNQSTVDR
jgi:hypothetical protein